MRVTRNIYQNIQSMVVVAFTKKEIRHIRKTDRAANRVNTQHFIRSKYISVRKRFILIL